MTIKKRNSITIIQINQKEGLIKLIIELNKFLQFIQVLDFFFFPMF